MTKIESKMSLEYKTPLKLIHPVCKICGGKWDWELENFETVKNGYGNKYIETFCPSKSEDHDLFYYYQNDKNECSFTRECLIENNFFVIDWNCLCPFTECLNKNKIMLITGSQVSQNEKITIIRYFDPPIPYDASHEAIWDYIKNIMVLI